MKRRVFARAFVATTAAAVVTMGGCATPCNGRAKVGDSCSGERRCWLDGQSETQHDCGLNGYECRDGRWSEVATCCIPPSPEPPASASAAASAPPPTPLPTAATSVAPDGFSTCPPDLRGDTPCDVDGARCRPEDQGRGASGCGLHGYECRGGLWRAMVRTCNPPSPRR